MDNLKLWFTKEAVENQLAYEKVGNIHLCKDWLVMYDELVELRQSLKETFTEIGEYSVNEKHPTASGVFNIICKHNPRTE